MQSQFLSEHEPDRSEGGSMQRKTPRAMQGCPSSVGGVAGNLPVPSLAHEEAEHENSEDGQEEEGGQAH